MTIITVNHSSLTLPDVTGEETKGQKNDEQNGRFDQRPNVELKGEWSLVPDSLGQRKHDAEWMLTLPDACLNYSYGKQIGQKVVIKGSSEMI